MRDNEKLGNDLKLIRAVLERNEFEFDIDNGMDGTRIECLDGDKVVFEFSEHGDLLMIKKED